MRYIFASLKQKTAALTVRLNYSITPDISIEYYGQPFISAGKYTEFKNVHNPMADEFQNRFFVFNPNQISFNASQNMYYIDEGMDGSPDYSVYNPNFNFLEFRSNLVIRWQYNPGSAVYLVWSQGRTGITSSGDFSLGNGISDLFHVKPYNVFLLKFSYMFNL